MFLPDHPGLTISEQRFRQSSGQACFRGFPEPGLNWTAWISGNFGYLWNVVYDGLVRRGGHPGLPAEQIRICL